MSWHLAPALVTLRDQVNKRWPKRSKASDGAVGDTSHKARKSDHNPDSQGRVHAIDITHDPKGGFDSYRFAEHLRTAKDPRISYVISNKKIFSSTVSPWIWRTYKGSNPHSAHVHVSVRSGAHAASTKQWSISAIQMGLADLGDTTPEPIGEDNDPAHRCHYDELQIDPEDKDEGE